MRPRGFAAPRLLVFNSVLHAKPARAVAGLRPRGFAAPRLLVFNSVLHAKPAHAVAGLRPRGFATPRLLVFNSVLHAKPACAVAGLRPRGFAAPRLLVFNSVLHAKPACAVAGLRPRGFATPRLSARPRRQKFPHRQPSGHTAVARLCKRHAVLQKQLRRAFSRVLPAVPQVRRSQPGLHLVAAVHLQQPPRRRADDMSLAVFPFSVVPSLVQLPVHNGAPLLVHSHPKRRQHVHAVIQRHIAPPVRRDAVRPAHMHIAVKFREILALENVPLAQQPRPALFLRQIFQHAHIVRVVRHQGIVVVHIGGDKHIVFGMLRLFVPPVDEQPLHPGVPHAAGVAGQIKALWEVVGSAQACRQRGELELRELRGLVHKNNVVLLPLVLQHVALAAAITEYDAAAAGEREGFVRVPVPGNARKVRRHRQDMVFPQLRERAAHDQNAGARVRQRQPGGFFAHRPAFAAAARPAVCDKACARLKKFNLPRVRLPDVPLHQPISSRTSFDITTCTAAPPFPSMGCEALPYTRSSMVFAASIRWGSVAFSSSTVRTSICTAARAAACSSSCALCAQAASASGAGERRACLPSAASRCGEAGTGACGPSAFWVCRARSGAAFRCARSPCAAVCFAAPASPPRTAVLLLSLFAVFALVCSPPRFQLGFCCAKTGAAGRCPHWGQRARSPIFALLKCGPAYSRGVCRGTFLCSPAGPALAPRPSSFSTRFLLRKNRRSRLPAPPFGFAVQKRARHFAARNHPVRLSASRPWLRHPAPLFCRPRHGCAAPGPQRQNPGACSHSVAFRSAKPRWPVIGPTGADVLACPAFALLKRGPPAKTPALAPIRSHFACGETARPVVAPAGGNVLATPFSLRSNVAPHIPAGSAGVRSFVPRLAPRSHPGACSHSVAFRSAKPRGRSLPPLGATCSLPHFRSAQMWPHARTPALAPVRSHFAPRNRAAGHRPHRGRCFAVPVTAPPRRVPNGKTPALLVFNPVFSAQKPAGASPRFRTAGR